MLVIRVLALLAFIVWVAIIPLAKWGRTGTAVFFVPLALFLSTWLLVEWRKNVPADGKARDIGLPLRVSLLLSLIVIAIAVYSLVFQAPAQVTQGYEYVIQKLLYLSNRLQLVLGLNDVLAPSRSRGVEIAFYTLGLAFLIWLFLLKINTVRLILFGGLVIIGLLLGVLSPTGEFRVSSFSNSAQVAMHVAAAPGGGFVVAWQSKGQDGGDYGIYGQLYGAEGVPRGANFQVNTTTADSQHDPFIAMTAGGDFVVVWVSDAQNRGFSGIYGQRFDAAGNKLGEEFQINTFSDGNHSKPIVASDANGNFVVVWESVGQDGDGKGVYGRRYHPSGAPLGDAFQVNSTTAKDQYDVWIAIDDSNGGSVITWSSGDQDGSGYGIFGRRFDATGTFLSDEFQINNFTNGDQKQSSVSFDKAGNFVVVWESQGPDGSGKGICGRRFNNEGRPAGEEEFRLNIYTADDQLGPVIAHLPDGDFVVIWSSIGQDGSAEGVFGRIYSDPGF